MNKNLTSALDKMSIARKQAIIRAKGGKRMDWKQYNEKVGMSKAEFLAYLDKK